MNQQAFYRDTAIGEFQLDANGVLAYRSWSCRKRTNQANQHRLNKQMSTFIGHLQPNALRFFNSRYEHMRCSENES